MKKKRKRKNGREWEMVEKWKRNGREMEVEMNDKTARFVKNGKM